MCVNCQNSEAMGKLFADPWEKAGFQTADHPERQKEQGRRSHGLRLCLHCKKMAMQAFLLVNR